MADILEIPEKHKRLELFIASLKKQQRKFNHPMDAHAHIKQSLLEIEKKTCVDFRRLHDNIFITGFQVHE